MIKSIQKFQSHLGLISFGQLQRGLEQMKVVSIPPWSDFFLMLRLTLILMPEFQSHLGLISFPPSSLRTGSQTKGFNPTLVWFLSVALTACALMMHSQFQSHLGLISFFSKCWLKATATVVSIPPWSDFFPATTLLTSSFCNLFQSHLGLISFLHHEAVWSSLYIVSIPPWSDFFQEKCECPHLGKYPFQSHLGLISFYKVMCLHPQPHKLFQSHLGLISFQAWMPDWASPVSFNPTLVWFLSQP